MGKNSKIEWTDHTFNPWIGCTKVSPGCKNCYAEALMDHRMGRVEWGPGKPRSRTSEGNWQKPLRWNRQAHIDRTDLFYGQLKNDGEIVVPWEQTPRPRVFCASLADWLDPAIPTEWLADLLVLIHSTPHLDWLLLTKRPQLWRSRMEEVAGPFVEGHPQAHQGSELAYEWACGSALKNVWVGTTVEDQRRAEERVPALLSIPAVIRFLSMEPLLEHVDLGFTTNTDKPWSVDWVICGGESGANARPMHPVWARALRDQCAAAGVPFFFKQWGEFAPAAMHSTFGLDDMQRVGKKRAGRLLDEVLHDALPLSVHA